MRVLLVDDEPEIVDFLKIILERRNIECVGVNSPEDAIAVAEKLQFDAIVSDFRMPKMTGLEMIAHIKGGNLNAQTPTIVLSGNLTDELLMRLEKLGIIDVMSKPPDIDILIRVIEKAGLRRPQRTNVSYHPDIVAALSDSFRHTMVGHLGDRVQISAPIVLEEVPTDIEYCGLASIFGRRLSGMLAVSYQTGFTVEFARALLGRTPLTKELEIFETTTGEIAQQIVQDAMPEIERKLGLHTVSAAPLIVVGRSYGVPLPTRQPRIQITASLGGKSCFLEFAFYDLAQEFAKVTDNADAKILT